MSDIDEAVNALMASTDDPEPETEPETVDEQPEPEPEGGEVSDDDGIPIGDLAAALGLAEDRVSVTDDGDLRLVAKIKGEDTQITVDEAVRSYQMQSVQDAKSADLNAQAQERARAIETENQQFAARVAEVDNTYSQLQQAVAQQVDSPEMQQLRATDPARWAAAAEDARQQIARLDSMRQTNAKAWQDQQATYASQRKQSMEPHAALLFRTLDADPTLADVRSEKGQRTALAALRSAGYNDADIAAAGEDPRVVLLAVKAARLDEMLANAKPEAKKIKRQVRVVRPGAKQKKVDKKMTHARGVKALRNSGKEADAVALLLNG